MNIIIVGAGKVIGALAGTKATIGVRSDAQSQTAGAAQPIEQVKNNVIVIMNTNKRRELADSKYNERRAECEKALIVPCGAGFQHYA